MSGTLSAYDIETGAVYATTLAATMGVVAGYVTSYSDMRLKKDVEEVVGAVEKLNALRPVFYNWNEKASMNPAHKELGFLAQEVEAVIPNVVLTASDEMGTKSVAYDRLVSLLVAAVKEQDVRIKALEAKSA